MTHAITSSGIQPGVESVVSLDLPLMIQSGATPLATAGVRTSYQIYLLYSAVPESLAGKHSLDMGFAWNRNYITNRWNALGGLEAVFVNGASDEVVRWNTPTAASQHMQNASLFVQVAWKPTRWLWMPIGVRLDTFAGRAPAAKNGIQWTTLQPRTGLVFPIPRSGLILRASWSRYAHLLRRHFLDFGNPAAPPAQTLAELGQGFAEGDWKKCSWRTAGGRKRTTRLAWRPVFLQHALRLAGGELEEVWLIYIRA